MKRFESRLRYERVNMRLNEFHVGSNAVPEVAAGAARYRQMNGFLSPEQDYSRSVVPPSQTQAIGRAYMAMPEHDPAAIPAYKQMGEEVGRQFDHMTKPRSKGGMGIDVSVHDSDPYGADDANKVMPELRADVANNQHIGVLSTASTGGHPVFTNDQNDMFRAVHDMFGHLGSGRGVDRHGEDAAYQKHAAMFSPQARGALATETRGQNAALHYNGGQFQDQKIGLLPQHMQVPRNLQSRQFGEMPGAAEQARGFNRNQGIV